MPAPVFKTGLSELKAGRARPLAQGHEPELEAPTFLPADAHLGVLRFLRLPAAAATVAAGARRSRTIRAMARRQRSGTTSTH
jgi:hypothetical protein